MTRMLTLDYVAGFLDGEGSVTLSRDRKHAQFKTPMVTFSNNIRSILEDIQQFLNLGGSIIRKNETRMNCSPSYTLQYKDDAALRLCALLQDRLRHPSKKARAQLLVSTYKSVTPRNGKYSAEMLERKLELEERFSKL